MKKKVIQSFTAVIFFSLIIGFVIYRGGFLEKSNFFTYDPNGTVIKQDTSKNGNKNQPIMPSSKVLILTEEEKQDTIIQIPEINREKKKDSSFIYMGSSKSHAVFPPKTEIKKDTNKNQK